jgi:hypothetical protein
LPDAVDKVGRRYRGGPAIPHQHSTVTPNDHEPIAQCQVSSGSLLNRCLSGLVVGPQGVQHNLVHIVDGRPRNEVLVDRRQPGSDLAPQGPRAVVERLADDLGELNKGVLLGFGQRFCKRIGISTAAL